MRIYVNVHHAGNIMKRHYQGAAELLQMIDRALPSQVRYVCGVVFLDYKL
jgi:hypothetical protein